MNEERKLLIANWKMNKLLEETESFIRNFTPTILCKTEIVICPPFHLINKLTPSTLISVGAQDCCALSDSYGAYTGEISAAMLKDLNCKYVIIGHSERRKYFLENDELISSKFANAVKHNLTPIVCIGESLEQRTNGTYLEILENSLFQSLAKATKSDNFIVAYEPIWSIGTGKTPDLNQIVEIHQFLSEKLLTRFAKKIKILYGGSVSLNNSNEILSLNEVSGLLIGGASLDPKIFELIVNRAEG